MDPESPSHRYRARPPISSVTAGISSGMTTSVSATVAAGTVADNTYRDDEGADALAAGLGEIKHEAVHEEKVAQVVHMHSNVIADVVLKLSNVCGDSNIPADISSAFTKTVCRIVETLEEAISEEDISTFRRLVSDVADLARRALQGEKDSKGEYLMTISLVDLLRSSFDLRPPDPETGKLKELKEYSRKARSIESQYSCDVLKCIRGVSPETDHQEAYSTASIFDLKLEQGLQCLVEMFDPSHSDKDLLRLLKDACRPLAQSLYALCFSTLFDGQRLRAGAWVCHKWIVNTNFKHADDVNNHLSGALSNVSMQRIKSAFSIFCGLSRFNMKMDTSYECCRDSEHWKSLDDLCNPVIDWMCTPGLDVCSKPSTAISCVVGKIADWFQESIGDPGRFETIYKAFTAQALVLDSRCAGKELSGEFRDYLNHYRLRAVSITQAAEFLCEFRYQRGGGSMTFMTAVMVVMSGVVGSWFCKGIAGPFVLCHLAGQCVADIFYRMPQISYSINASKADIANGASTVGNKCSATKITRNMMDTGEVRGEHEKGDLVETRLRASLTVLSIKESLARDLKDIRHHVTAATTEGIKNLRSVYITALRVLPGIKVREADKASSALIERTDGKTSASANGSNVEKPWRDVCGGIVATSILRPQAAMSLKNTIEGPLLEYGALYTFNRFTNECVDEFAKKLVEDSINLFNDSILSVNVNDQQYARSVRVFAQQRAFVSVYCDALKDCGLVWEQLQNSFAQAEPKDTAGQGPSRPGYRKRPCSDDLDCLNHKRLNAE